MSPFQRATWLRGPLAPYVPPTDTNAGFAPTFIYFAQTKGWVVGVLATHFITTDADRWAWVQIVFNDWLTISPAVQNALINTPVLELAH
jgi:hypothetical protein